MDIEKKIRKLLALSESPNEFEAQAALLKARQLMAEYMCKYFYICSGLRFNTDTKFETDIL